MPPAPPHHSGAVPRDGRGALRRAFDALDARLVGAMRAGGPLLLRWALGLVFLWFGALKLAGASPVADLVERAVPLPPGWAVPLLGLAESAVGLGLLAGVALRAVLALFWLLLAGTLTLLVLHPGIVFQGGNPLLLTLEGEFVVKNLVLLAAGIVVGGSVRTRQRSGAARRPRRAAGAA